MTLKYEVTGVIIATLLMTLLGSQMGTAFGSGLGRSDFDEHPERFCAGFGPGNEDLCADLDICDDEGKINSTSSYHNRL